MFNQKATQEKQVTIPEYLSKTYWWAYLHPTGVHFFERQWMVNLILFGNYNRLCEQVLSLFKENKTDKSLQIACVYGSLTEKLAKYHQDKGQLDIVDVAPIQLSNLKRKLPLSCKVGYFLQDSACLNFADNNYHNTLLFFLLHEQPLKQRLDTLKEALRVTKPGGKLIIVDYHRPQYWFPFRYILSPILKFLEPYAKDLWKYDIKEWLPGIPVENIRKTTYFGGLYQKLVVTIP